MTATPRRLGLLSIPAAFLLLAPPLVRAQTFTDVAQAFGFPSSNDSTRGMAWADVDGDGDFDVYLQNQGSTSRLLRNDGTTFVDVTASMAVSHASSGWSAAWGDFDRDGKPDLYTGNFQANNLFRNNFPAAFTDVAVSSGSADNSFAQGVSWIDHDKDGDLDLYVTQELDPFRFFRNNGNGTFTDLTAATGLGDPQSHGYGLTWADFDEDGDFDCFVSTCGSNTINRLFRSNLAGAGVLLYSEVAAVAGVNYQPNTYGAHFVDLDEDGDFDLFVAGASGEPNHLYRNDGVLPMVDVAVAAGVAGPPTNGHGCDVGDYDNDGWQDIYVHDFAGANRLYRNLGGLVFAEVPNAGGANDAGATGYDCVFVDFDDDGDLDIHAGTSGRDRLYRNAGNANHWLQVLLEGTKDNRSAIGATVEAVVGGASRYRLYSASAGAFSQNLLPAHFGLGSATIVDQVIVHWLDGTTDTLVNVAADQRISVKQSSGAATTTLLGVGCPNSLGNAPSLAPQGMPLLGNAGFGFVVAGAPASVPVAFYFALAPLPVPIDPGNGCALWLDLAGMVLLGSGTTSVFGAFSIPVPIPNVYAFAGGEITVQAVVLDPSGPAPVWNPALHFTLTNGQTVRVGY